MSGHLLTAVHALAWQLFSKTEREDLVRRMCEAELGEDAKRLDVVCFDGLVVEFAKQNDVNFLVRGLRAFSGAELFTIFQQCS